MIQERGQQAKSNLPPVLLGSKFCCNTTTLVNLHTVDGCFHTTAAELLYLLVIHQKSLLTFDLEESLISDSQWKYYWHLGWTKFSLYRVIPCYVGQSACPQQGHVPHPVIMTQSLFETLPVDSASTVTLNDDTQAESSQQKFCWMTQF